MNETKLVASVDVELDGYYAAARRDGGRVNGGGVAIYVACDLAAVGTFTSPAGVVEAAEVEIIGRGGTAACRVLVVYRPRGLEAFGAIEARAAEAAAVGVPLVVLGDLNASGVRDERRLQRPGGRPPRATASAARCWLSPPEITHESPLGPAPGPPTTPGPPQPTTPEARRLDATLEAGGLAVASGLGAPRWTHLKPGCVPSELDLALVDSRAAALVVDGGTENGGGATQRPFWAFSHHRLVWVALELDAAPQPEPAVPRFASASWKSADADAHAAYAANLATRLEPWINEVEAHGFGRWRGDTQAALGAVVGHIHAAEAATVGLAGQARRLQPTPAWWTPACATAALQVPVEAAALAEAHARRDGAAVGATESALRAARSRLDRACTAAQASFFEWRLARARDDPRAMAAVYAELRAHLAQKRPRGGRGTAHVWRALTSNGRVISGTAIGPELASIVEAKFRYNGADPRFCRSTALRREADTARLRSFALPAECAVDVTPGGGPVTPTEVAEARALIKRDKVPHPEDGVVPEALIYGGEALDEALALAFSHVLETGVVPAVWRTGAMRCVPKKGNTSIFTNHRGVVLTSHVAKLFERVMLRRLLTVAEADEAQAVANAGVDCRTQIHLLLDACAAYRDESGGDDVWIMTIDITRGFPSTPRALVVEALRTAGVGGRLMRAIMGLIFGTSVVVGVRPGVETRRVPLGVGLLEGAVLSPALFALATSGLLVTLRASGLGVRVGGVWAGALMLMDDLALLARSEAELREMTAIVFRWAHENRYVLALSEKSHVLRLGPVDEAPAAEATCTRFRWSPPDGAPEATIDVSFKHESTLAYLGFLVSARGGPDAHVGRQLGTASSVVDRMEAEYGGRACITFGQALYLWTLHGRSHVEWPAAVLPPGGRATVRFDQLQFRALRALLGDHAHRPAYRVLLAVFGLWNMEERYLFARAKYAFAWLLAERRPWRAALGSTLRRLDVDGDDDGFPRESVTGAVSATLVRLGFDDWPEDLRPDEGAFAPGIPGRGPAAAPAPPNGDSSSDDEAERPADDADADAEADEPADADANPRRRWDAEVRRRCAALALAREEGLFATAADGTLELKSAALWLEIAGTGATETRRRALRRWMRRCVLNLTANAGGAAAVGVICGCWWAAPTSRVPDSGGAWRPATCAACGATSRNLATHLLLGGVDGEPPCACPIAALYRADWEADVRQAYAAYADAEATVAFATAPPRSLRRVALMLGFAAGVDLPWELSSRLPSIFARVWGPWSQTTRDAAAQGGR